MFYDSTWQDRAGKVIAALGALVDEHGAPNRFHGSDVAALTGLKIGAVRRVGRYGGEMVVRSRLARYKAGWFEIGDDLLADLHRESSHA